MTLTRVLIIDDDDDVREVAQLCLEVIAGWEVSIAASGEEGLARAASGQPDVVLLDVMMPGLDGVETLRRLRSAPMTEKIPVIFLTAKTQASEQDQLRAAGARGLIPKPFNPMTLAGEISELLAGPDGARDQSC